MKKKKWGVLIFILILVALSYGGYYMNQQQYQMYVLVTPDSENDPEWPRKRKWFDASKWLRTSQYIKIDQSYLLNIKYIPIENLNDYGITLTLQDAIRDAIKRLPELLPLSKMDEGDFFNLMKDNISYEYLRTEFDSKTLKPTNDYFLFFFNYKGNTYEVELLRKVTDYGLMFMPYGYNVDEKGYWHSIYPAGYSYRDYLAGKPVK